MRYHGMAVMKRGDCKRSFYGGAAAPAARRLRLGSCSEQHLDACGQRHFQRTSEQDAFCAHTHACASRSRSHAPRSAKSTSEIPENKGLRPASGAMAVTRRGNAAPSAKLAADVNAV